MVKTLRRGFLVPEALTVGLSLLFGLFVRNHLSLSSGSVFSCVLSSSEKFSFSLSFSLSLSPLNENFLSLELSLVIELFWVWLFPPPKTHSGVWLLRIEKPGERNHRGQTEIFPSNKHEVFSTAKKESQRHHLPSGCVVICRRSGFLRFTLRHEENLTILSPISRDILKELLMVVSQMDSVKPSAVSTPHKSKLARTIAKVLHLRAATGIAPVDGIHQKLKKSQEFGNVHHKESNTKFQDKLKDEYDDHRNNKNIGLNDDDEELEERIAMEALLAKLFASISTVKSAYAQLQFSQSPYDSDGIQSADRVVISELKRLSEVKRCYLKKQFDPSPEKALIAAEIQEQKSLLKTYEITGKKLESQVRLKESEVLFLREKLDEANKQNKLFGKTLNQSGQLLSVLDNLHLSGLSPGHFITVLRHAIRSIRSFVRLVVEEMKSADWDLDAAAYAIQPDVVYWREEHKCFAFESFVSREMFDCFCYPNFHLKKESSSSVDKRKQREKFFARFMELKSVKTKDYLLAKPRSAFANFCRVKYLKLVHPKMEHSFFGNLNQRNLVHAGEISTVCSSSFFVSFAEMAKRVWLLHCLAFSFDPEALIFQIPKGCRFSEVYMESIAEEVFPSLDNSSSNNNYGLVESESQVAFTVIPGFRIGKAVIQSKVYLSQIQHRTEHSR